MKPNERTAPSTIIPVAIVNDGRFREFNEMDRLGEKLTESMFISHNFVKKK